MPDDALLHPLLHLPVPLGRKRKAVDKKSKIPRCPCPAPLNGSPEDCTRLDKIRRISPGSTSRFLAITSKRATSSRAFTSAMKPPPLRATVPRTGASESRRARTSWQKARDRHSILPISSMTYGALPCPPREAAGPGPQSPYIDAVTSHAGPAPEPDVRPARHCAPSRVLTEIRPARPTRGSRRCKTRTRSHDRGKPLPGPSGSVSFCPYRASR